MPTIEAPGPPEDANAAAEPALATAPTTPAVKKKSSNSSPKKAGNGGTTPASAPAKAKAGEKKKPEPTLLQDFLRGRPTASRPTASRPRRKSSGIAHAEVKMSAVNKLTPPAKVKNRVMEWQKASRNAGAPEVTGLEEPTIERVEDKQKPARSQSAGPRKEASPPVPSPAATPEAKERKTPEGAAPVTKPKAAAARKPKKPNVETPMPPTARGAQMKRVVSDTHWVNKAAKKETPVVKDPIFNLLLNSGAVKKAATTKPSPPKVVAPKAPQPKKLPKDFTETNWANPPVERKIQDWVKRTSAEASANGQEEDAEAVRAYEEAVKEAQKSRSSSKSPAKLEVPGAFKRAEVSKQPTPELKGRISREDTKKERPTAAANEKPAALPKKPEEKKERVRRVRAARPEEIAAALGLPPPERKGLKQRRDIDKKYEADGHRRLASYGAGRDNGRNRELDDEDDARYRSESYDRPYKYTSRRNSRLPDDYDDSTITSLDDLGLPRRQASKPQQRKARDQATTVTADTLSTLTSDSETTEAPRRQASRRQPRMLRDEKTTFTADTLSTLTSDSESTLSDTASIRRDDMKRESKRSLRGKRSLDEIPVGYSAFSVLDLSPGGQPRSRPAKPLRKASLGLPNVLKRVYNEGMKIMQDTVDPPQVVIKNPPNIDNWLNNTTDPFLDDPAKLPAGSQTKPNAPEKPHRERSQSYKTSRLTSNSPDREGTPTRANFRPKSSNRNYDGRDGRDHLRNSSLTETAIPESSVLENSHELYTGPKRRPARRENSSPFTERKSTRDLRSPQPGRDLNSYADSLSRDSGRNSRAQPRSQEFDMVKSTEPLAPDRRASPRIVEQTSRHSLKEKMSDVEVKEASELTRHSRLRRIPSSGPNGRLSRRQDRSSALKPQESLKKPPSGQPSRYVSSRALEGPGLKRRLTKHSDLMSMLSLPDTNVQHGASIAPARSIRTRRAPVDSRDVSLILAEVTADEEKYFRELRTLVDGVIPVLLSSVLARSNSIAVSRSSPPTDAANISITKSVIEMGDALKQLKTLHTQIPLNDPELFILWLLSAHAAYTEYLNAWRLGFDDIVVNLAPAAHSDSDNAGLPQTSDLDTEAMEVAYLLRRPNARVKYLFKAAKGLSLANPTKESRKALEQYESLTGHERHRAKEELARKQDMLAINLDVSRARFLRTLAPAPHSRINETRRVKAKDYFDLSLTHSSGQRLACEVEMIVRDSPRGYGDVLICEVNEHSSSSLLFPPMEIGGMSACQGEYNEDLVIMVRGCHDGKDWAEIFTLHAEHADIAQEFMELVGSEPMPPSITSKEDARPSTPITPRSAMMSGGLGSMDYPIGEATPNRANGMTQSSATRWENNMATDHVYDRDDYVAKTQTFEQIRRPPSDIISQLSTPLSTPSSKEGHTPPTLRPQTKRRPSSPLKKEYNPENQAWQRQPHPSEAYTSDSYDSYSESELTDSEFDDDAPVAPAAAAAMTQESTPRSTPPPPEGYCFRFTGYINCWRVDLGRYEDLHKDLVSIRVSPGKCKIMEMDASHSAPNHEDADNDKRPLFELDLNPRTQLAQRTGLDVEIRAAQMETSLLKARGYIRVRSADTFQCVRLYKALAQGRKDNVVYNQLEQERIVNGYGQQQQEETVEEFQSRRSWFGRKQSYRASTRAPTVDSSSSKFSFGNAFTALDRFKKDNRSFDIEKSSMRSGGIFGRSRNSRESSQYANEDTISNGFTPPQSYDPSLATTGTIDTTQFDTTFMKVRLYVMHPRAKQWVDLGECQITVSPTPEWMKESSNLYNGYQKRVTLTEILEERPLDKINKRLSTVLGGVDQRVPEVKFDQIVGARCCAKTGRKGIVMQVWEEMRGTNGEVGRAPAEGGVCGRQQKYLMQSSSTSQARFIFALLGAGGGAGYDV